MKYSAWGSNGVANTLIPDEQREQLLKIEPALEFVRMFEAETWDDALTQYHAWQGWEEYRPETDEE